MKIQPSIGHLLLKNIIKVENSDTKLSKKLETAFKGEVVDVGNDLVSIYHTGTCVLFPRRSGIALKDEDGLRILLRAKETLGVLTEG